MSTTVRATQTRVYDVVTDALVAAGIECIFGMLGEDVAPLAVAAGARGILYYAARHENQAVAMADGYFRATGRTGVATVTGGPGFSNAVTAINTSHRASSGVLLLIGAGRPEEDDHERAVLPHVSWVNWLKYFPQASTLALLGVEVFKPLEASAVSRDVRSALARARGGTVGLVLGRDVLLQTVPADIEAPLNVPVAQSPDPDQIGAFVDLLQEGWAVRRPIILAGRGAAAADARPALERLGELTGALLATTLRGKSFFRGHPYDLGVCGTFSNPVASGLILEADCVLAFGAGLNQFTTYKNTMFPKALIVQVDTNEDAFGRFVDVELGIIGDARSVAEGVVAELEARGHSATGYRDPEIRRAIAAYNPGDDVRDNSTPELIDPRTLTLELNRILPPDRIFCADAGQHAQFTIRYLEVQEPRNFMQALDAGSIGLGIGTAVGSAVGRPGTVVVAGIGDAGMMMSLGDLETAVRLRLPILVVILNDEALGAEVNVLCNLGLDPHVAEVPSPSFEAVAAAMGARAATVRTVGDLAIVENWLRRPIEGPLILDCRTNPAVRGLSSTPPGAVVGN
jgi:thiamine pyrophosphate-dependent acetolactate synthase large subunit-like protein